MSEPNSPIDDGGERVYRFISDPGHKENLSGRVRAACLTCRRKKIKCSGEVNCLTCREKGLVCEGVPERKRPSKEQGTSVILGPIPAGVERKRRESVPKKCGLRRLSTTLKPAGSPDSHDSEHLIARGDFVDRTVSPSTSAASTGTIAQASSTLRLPSRVRQVVQSNPQRSRYIDTWQLNGNHAGRFQSFQDNQHNPLNIESQTAQYPDKSTSELDTPREWSHFQQSNGWWPERSVCNEQDLMSSSQALADEASLLRMMETRPFVNEAPGNTIRRQTVVFPLESSLGLEPQFDMSGNQPIIFDDLALLSTIRTPRTGLTPNLTEFTSWWEINGVGDMVSFLGNGGAIAPLPTDNLEQRTILPLDQTTQYTSHELHAPDASYYARSWPGRETHSPSSALKRANVLP